MSSNSFTSYIVNAPRLDNAWLSTVLTAPSQFVQVATKSSSVSAGYRQIDPQGSIVYNPTDQDIYYSDGVQWNLLGGKGGSATAHGDIWIWNGSKWLLASSIANGNLYIGYNALNTTSEAGGVRNTAIGTSVLIATTAAANDNVGLGYKSGIALTSGTANIVIGTLALGTATTDVRNIAIGYQALGTQNTATAGNIGIGYQAGLANTTGVHNTSIGNLSLSTNITGSGSVAIGYRALNASTISGNTAVGYGTAVLASTATNLTAIGYLALSANLTGNSNTAVGYSAGILVTGASNTIVGDSAAPVLAGGASNVVVGAGAGTVNATGSNCVYIGAASVGSGAAVSGETVIGQGATGKGANTIFLSAPSANQGLFSNAPNITGGTSANLINLSFNTSTNQLVGNGSRPVVTLPATGVTAVTAAQSGSLFNLVQATGNTTINLPAPFLGANFKFVVSATANGANTQAISSSGANCSGFLIGPASATTSLANVSAKTTATLSATAANVKLGDYIEYNSVDGSTYAIQAYSSGTAVGWSFT
jgi:hypothetical protein